ncbi:MAG: hypothetical protein WCA44_12325 [Acidobacteriaceae bacterium]
MYIARGDGQFDVASLRQGDILEGVPFPLIDPADLHMLGAAQFDREFTEVPELRAVKHVHRKDPEWVKALLPIRFGFCIVLSNCCDLEPHDGGNISAPVFTMARLHPIPLDIVNSAELYESLKANKDPRDPADPGYIDYFYLEPHAKLQNREWRVHFNQVVTLPTKAIGTILMQKKILQLDDRTRVKFKIKLGFTLMRINEGERASGLEDPWKETADQPAAPPPADPTTGGLAV